MDQLFAFANAHPVATFFILVPVIGWSAQIVIAFIKAL